MDPPDWNWADFCGIELVESLITSGALVSPELSERMRIALHHAAYSIFRRNIHADYSNIAVLGAVVTGLAGEFLADPFLLAFSRRRLNLFWERAERVQGVDEYNSPTYNMVILHALSRLLRLSHDAGLCAVGMRIFEFMWRGIAEHYHAATGQWAGPHSRAYTDVLTPDQKTELALATGYPIGEITPEEASERVAEPPLMCPEPLRTMFDPDTMRYESICRTFLEAEPPAARVWGTTWFNGDLVLGTVNHENTWVQRHPVIGYWKAAGETAVFRVRFLRDGKDFGSGLLLTVQKEGAFVSGLSLLTDRGDFHNHLDHPADGYFLVSDFRLRVELQAPDADLHEVAPGVAVLSSGAYEVGVSCAGGSFDGAPVMWEYGKMEGSAYADIICYQGDKKPFDFRRVEEAWVFVCAAIGERGTGVDRTLSGAVCRVEGTRALCAWPLREIEAACNAVPMEYAQAVQTGMAR